MTITRPPEKREKSTAGTRRPSTHVAAVSRSDLHRFQTQGCRRARLDNLYEWNRGGFGHRRNDTHTPISFDGSSLPVSEQEDYICQYAVL